MRKFFLQLVFPATFMAGISGHTQDFSNKGKDFWVGYGLHARMYQGAAGSGGTQEMVLYFATEAITNVTVSIPLLGYSQTYNNIPANTIFTTNPIPKTGANDARLTTEGISSKGIHITSDKPIVAYAHIYNGNVSGATLLFPTPTLGKEYFSMNFTQNSNEANANCFFYAIAVDTGTTTVEVKTPANTQSMIPGNTYTYNLQQGQIFNALGIETSAPGGLFIGSDLSGATIRSISTGSGGCKRIAVFSGAGKLFIRCASNQPNSADNYMVQAFPKTAWGKYFLTVPTQNFENNFFRIGVSDPTTVVKVNGVVQAGLVNNFYYQIGTINTPNLIEADKPIMVSQYITTQGACSNGPVGDPEVIYLSPVEQNIDKVILNSTPNFAIQANLHFINVVIPNGGTALSSFRIDGAPPSTSFIVHPQNNAYSYLKQPVSQGQHTVQSDSGFNAIAYGYGSAESYGYNAGANVKDLYQFVSVQNQYATVTFPAACKNSPFYFSMTFPYQPTQIQWVFGAVLNAMGITNVTINNPVFDSTWFVNGRQLYLYRLPTPYTITTSGTYPIQVFAQNPTPDGCSGQQEIDYDLQVFDPPVADFTFSNNGCVTDTVFFFDASNLNGRSAIKWHWDFGDSGIDSIRNTKHKYAAPGSYTVKYSLITDIGCLSDTASKVVNLTAVPTAKFGATSPHCVNKIITFTDSSVAYNGATLVKWYWNFGDGSPQVIAASNAPQTHAFAITGIFNVTLKVETTTGCQSIVFTLPVTIHANPVASFNLPNVCLPVGAAQFADQSTISDGTQNLFTYQWNFGDGATSIVQNPLHNYAGLGPYTVTLTVTSNNGCVDDSISVLNTIYAEPQAAFTAPAEVCFGNAVNFSDQSTAAGSTVTQWNWNFGDGTTSTQQNPVKNYAAPGTYTITLSVTSAIGCQTINNIATKTVIVNPLPTANFNTSVPSCEFRNILFTDGSLANAGSLVKWTWNYGDGTNAVLATATPFNHIYATAGTYNVTLQVETNKGCVSSVLTKQVIVYPVPDAGFISPQICLTDPIAPFIDTSHVASGSIVTWSWNFGDPNATPVNPNTSALQNPGHRYSVVGTYTATLIITTNQGCKDTVAQTFTVNGSVPLAGFSVQNANTLCSNQDIAIADASTVDFGSIIRVEIYWDFGNNPAIKTTDISPVPGKIYLHRYAEFGNPFTQTYTVRYVVYSGINCVNTITKTITVLATPTLQFDPLNSLCANDPSFQITQAQLLNGLSGSATFTGPGVSANGLFNPATAGAGIHTIRYTYTGTNGCSNYLEQPIQVYPIPVVNAGPDRFMLEGGQTTLLGSGSGNNVSFLWTPNTSLSSNVVAQPTATPSDDITYTLMVTSADGCKTSDQVFVKVLKAPIIPNIFSPNGDGVHDRWEIAYLESYPGCTVDVFNRYGQLIFHSIGYANPWDGTVNGKQVPVGTYYYIVDPKNGRKKVAGYVDVIR